MQGFKITMSGNRVRLLNTLPRKLLKSHMLSFKFIISRWSGPKLRILIFAKILNSLLCSSFDLPLRWLEECSPNYPNYKRKLCVEGVMEKIIIIIPSLHNRSFKRDTQKQNYFKLVLIIYVMLNYKMRRTELKLVH